MTNLTPQQIHQLEEIYTEPTVSADDFSATYKEVLANKEVLLKYGAKTPCYLFDKQGLLRTLAELKDGFLPHIPDAQFYYAVKSNDYPGILSTLVSQGVGIDVSSAREFHLALEAGATKIIFTGPAKTEADFQLVCEHADKTILMLDSFSELEKLSSMQFDRIKVGIRIFTEFHGKWSKFGIPLARLKEMIQLIKQRPQLDLQAIQCHISWNQTTQPYTQIITAIGDYLSRELSVEDVETLRYLDLGGGFFPDQFEGYYAWQTPQGKLQQLLNPDSGYYDFSYSYRVYSSVSAEEYGQAIGAAIDTHLRPVLPHVAYFFEPGRMLNWRSMHILLQIIDAKSAEFGITDGGINMVGWEKYEERFVPVINLTHPSPDMIQYISYGSLCTPHDLWGYYCFATHVEEGDILVLPYQGAYTYTLRQSFIKGLPAVIDM